MLALMVILEEESMIHELASAFFIECEDDLATNVECHWGEQATLRNIPKYTKLASEVWDPLRAQMCSFLSFCFALPVGAVVFLIGGSPCTNLSRAGFRQGALGLCGKDSVHFFAFPIFGWVIQFMRPDVHVLGFVENAHNMLPTWAESICKALGVPCTPSHKHYTNQAQWTAMARKRWIFSTYPLTRPLITPAVRPSPW